MKIKIKKLDPEAKIPTYAKPGDAGMDLYCLKAIYTGPFVTYHTGLAMEIPKGYVGLLFPRSSVYKTGQTLTNCVGVIDSGYRGEIMLKYTRGKHLLNPNHINLNAGFKEYEPEDRVGQIIVIPYPEIEFEEVTTLSATERGKGGYGSTGA
jgi:dUTP pyrophosphatase